MVDYADAQNIVSSIRQRETYFSWNLSASSIYDKETEVILVLNSSRILIGDIDDTNFDWKTVVQSCRDTYKFRFYRTYKGFRFFITNTEILANSDLCEAIFQEFNVDSAYSLLTRASRQYRARLSPKLRDGGVIDYNVAELIYTDTPLEELDLSTQTMIKTHDFFCTNVTYYDIFRKQPDSRSADDEGRQPF